MDLTLTHSREVPWTELASAVEEDLPPDLVRFGLKDVYSGRGVPEGAVNSTLTFRYVADDRSLTQEEVNERHGRLASRLEDRFGWKS